MLSESTRRVSPRLLSVALCLGLAAPAVGLSINNVSVSPASPGRLQPFTVDFSLSQAYSNPYNPDQIDVTFAFTGPSGTPRVIPAYWTGSAWRARIAPLEVGPHSCQIKAVDASGPMATHNLNFTAVASSERGFVRVPFHILRDGVLNNLRDFACLCFGDFLQL